MILLLYKLQTGVQIRGRVYERVRGKIADGVNELPDVEFSRTKELGRVNGVDPLGITYLRIRGMWGIGNPVNVFDSVIPTEKNANFFINTILLKEKYLSFLPWLLISRITWQKRYSRIWVMMCVQWIM